VDRKNIVRKISANEKNQGLKQKKIENLKNKIEITEYTSLSAMIKQFIQNVFWEDADFLIVDTPPGKVSFLLNTGSKQ
jgi:Mrp family chromosome partitioning ATPase